MFYGFGQRQQELLEALLVNKEGSTIDELSAQLGITRTAVQQHTLALEQGGYIERGSLTTTGGRPSQVYVLSQKGNELFPKQYSWFSELLLNSLKSELGEEGLEEKMRQIGRQLSEGLKSKIAGLDSRQKIEGVSKMMAELGFKAEAVVEKGGELPVIRASNCIYHQLAQEFEEVCQLDIALLESLLDGNVSHEECMVRGGKVCKFKIEGL